MVQRYRPASLTGSERYIDALTIYMLARGHKVDVYTSTALDWCRLFVPFGQALPQGVEDYGYLRIVRLKPSYFKQLTSTALCLLLKLPLPCFLRGPRLSSLSSLMLEDYDIIGVTPAPFPYLLDTLRAARRIGAGLVVMPFMHFDLREYRNPYLLSVIGAADAVIAATPCEAKILMRVYGARRVRVVEPGLWIREWLQGMPGREEARLKLGLGEDEFVILLPHRARAKGAYHVLEAATIVARKGIPISVLVFGFVKDKGFERLKRLATINGVKVKDLGAVDEVTKKILYAASDILAQPSIADSFGIVYLEAWAARKPVIAADTLAMKCVVRHGVDGFRVPFGNVKALAEKFLRLALDPGLREQMGEAGYRKVIRRYDWRIIGKRMEEVYYEVASSAQ